jgi:hypothetical protein
LLSGAIKRATVSEDFGDEKTDLVHFGYAVSYKFASKVVSYRIAGSVPVTGVGVGHLNTSRGIAEGCGALVKISAKTKRANIALYEDQSQYNRDNCCTFSFRGKNENTYRAVLLVIDL